MKESNRSEYYICSFNISYCILYIVYHAQYAPHTVCLMFRSKADSLLGKCQINIKYSTQICMAVVCKLFFSLFIFIFNFNSRSHCVNLPIAMANSSHKCAACNESTNHAKCEMQNDHSVKHFVFIYFNYFFFPVS